MATKRADGLIQRQVTINGIRKVFYGHSEREINRKIAEHKEEAARGRKFISVAEEWEEEHFPTLAYNTLKGYKPALARAKAEWGDEYIKKIFPKDIDRLLRQMARENYAQKTVRTQLLVCNLIFSYAVVEGDLEYNPATSVRIPKGLPKQRREIPAKKALDKVKASVDCTFGLFAYFLLYTGCRRGEALALRYEDIDRENKTIKICKSLYHENNHPRIKEPKTEAGVRHIVLLDVLADKLPTTAKGLVFPGEKGNYMTETQFQRKWRSYLKETGLSITPHQLRHAYATILFEAGLDPKDAQELLGHANISTTRDIYTHITQGRRESTAQKLNAIVSGQ